MSSVSSKRVELLKLLECVLYDNHPIFLDINFGHLRALLSGLLS